jgi:ATP phosphoribosyltransferase
LGAPSLSLNARRDGPAGGTGENRGGDVGRSQEVSAIKVIKCSLGMNVSRFPGEHFQGAGGTQPTFQQVQRLDYGRCRLALAVPDEYPYAGLASIAGRRIATTYPHVLARYLRENGIAAEIVTLSGAVEIAPRLGRADLICDLVSTGSTLRANHLREVATVLDSEAVLVRTPVPLSPEKEDWARRLLMRIDGVQQVRESKYIMLHAPRSALPQIRKLLPGRESPTVIPLDGTGEKVAVHAVCPENVFWETLEGLKAAGASSVLVLPVEKMLA